MGDITAGMAGHSICVQNILSKNELYGLVECHEGLETLSLY